MATLNRAATLGERVIGQNTKLSSFSGYCRLEQDKLVPELENPLGVNFRLRSTKSCRFQFQQHIRTGSSAPHGIPLSLKATSGTMKTAVTVLQEMMIKLGLCPEYECIAQSGPQHQATFEYRCSAHGHTVTATARSKKEAKQEAARVLLLRLAEHGLSVPAPFSCGAAPPPTGMAAVGAVSEAAGGTAARSYVALLSELCEEYRLPAAQYELTADTGPPHARHFTVSARLGLHERRATSTTKKSARQLAAEQLYTYLRENLSRLTKDFVEVM
ncbi:Interferon-inducible double stranded RNA-dependent protein kinase activator A-like A [Papilio xuthus]|uniref:Interferon-inducible double stranded RNA-dependent protein kinase activator A-like A n=1 Tax=Papilio xuthus TaxID=66420 RepID=A0A194QCB9_PAPXU|nr:Interferon-inducible double stranded RNA-dependent protein kinase activator A-like A [Papilio xuthus]